MQPLLSDFLILSDEPAVLARGGRVLQLNGSAAALFGADCVGRSVRQLFGDEVAGGQAPNFLASVSLHGQTRTVRVSRMEGMQLIFVSRDDRDLSVVNDASLAAMRGSLMNLGLAAEQGRRLVEELGRPELSASFLSITKQYYSLNRLVRNTAIVYALLKAELPVVLSAVDLAALCRSTVDTLSLFLSGVELRVNAPAVLPIHADRELLEVLLLNLLSNCFLHAGGLSAVTVSLMETEQSVILSVSDDGCGIPADALATVFSRYRSSFVMNAMPRGAGLGLSVVRGIADRHGGTLLLESREGQGTAVRVSLSRSLGGANLHGVPNAAPCEMSTLLTGLSGCLPDECFGARYLD